MVPAVASKSAVDPAGERFIEEAIAYASMELWGQAESALARARAIDKENPRIATVAEVLNRRAK
jgi:hypothetical protein